MMFQSKNGREVKTVVTGYNPGLREAGGGADPKVTRGQGDGIEGNDDDGVSNVGYSETRDMGVSLRGLVL